MSRRPPFLLVPLLFAVVPALLRAEPPAGPPPPHAAVEDALRAPPATGLLVTLVVAESQADKVGLEPGDVITAYGATPTPTFAALQGALAAAPEGPVTMKVARVGQAAREVRVAPGRLGVQLVAVEVGKPAGPLPPATDGVAFDLAALAKAPRDDWYVFEMGGRHVGYEHAIARVEEGRLVVRREVAFDGGQDWGLNHFDVSLEATTEAVPGFQAYLFENPLAGYVGEGRRERVEGVEGEAFTFSYRTSDDESGSSRFPLPQDLPTVPSYLVEVLASVMPRAPGTCFHFRLLSDGDGRLGLPNALRVAGEEEVLLADGTKVTAVKVEQHALGGQVTNRYWVAQPGRVVVGDYGGAVTRLATRQAALEDVDPELAPRSAGGG